MRGRKLEITESIVNCAVKRQSVGPQIRLSGGTFRRRKLTGKFLCLGRQTAKQLTRRNDRKYRTCAITEVARLILTRVTRSSLEQVTCCIHLFTTTVSIQNKPIADMCQAVKKAEAYRAGHLSLI